MGPYFDTIYRREGKPPGNLNQKPMSSFILGKKEDMGE